MLPFSDIGGEGRFRRGMEVIQGGAALRVAALVGASHSMPSRV